MRQTIRYVGSMKTSCIVLLFQQPLHKDGIGNAGGMQGGEPKIPDPIYSCLCLTFHSNLQGFPPILILRVFYTVNHSMKSESCSVVSDSLQPRGLYSPWDSPGQNTGVGCHFLLKRNLPNPGVEPRSPALQADSLPAEPQGKP